MQVGAGHGAAKGQNARRAGRKGGTEWEQERQLQARSLYRGGGCQPPLATRSHSHAPSAEPIPGAEKKERTPAVKDATYRSAFTRAGMTQALTPEDVRDLLTGFVAAIELDQIRVDALPPEKFHPWYSDSMWRNCRRDHIDYINRLLPSVNTIPSA